jgi:hypothetical protein
VFAVCAGLGVAAALPVAGLRVPPLASAPEQGRRCWPAWAKASG